jgi:UDP-glucose 4-epimerase
MKIAEQVTQLSDAQFIYVSSGGSVYGSSAPELVSEDELLNPISSYGFGKKLAETSIKFLGDIHGLRFTILRPANPIGPWQNNLNQGVVSALVRAARSGTTFTLIGDGHVVRDYFDVQDLIQALLVTANNPEVSVGKIWNVGSGRGHSVVEIIELVEYISKSEIKTKRIAARPSDVSRVILDSSAIGDALGWGPKISLETSLTSIWNHAP